MSATQTQARGYRKVREGLVVSDKMNKTVVVAVEDRFKHPLYGKVVRRTSKLKAHDEQNAAGVGDRVLLMETRPMSATKRWRVVEVVVATLEAHASGVLAEVNALLPRIARWEIEQQPSSECAASSSVCTEYLSSRNKLYTLGGAEGAAGAAASDDAMKATVQVGVLNDART